MIRMILLIWLGCVVFNLAAFIVGIYGASKQRPINKEDGKTARELCAWGPFGTLVYLIVYCIACKELRRQAKVMKKFFNEEGSQ